MHNVTIKFLKELDDMLKPRNIEFTFDEDALEWLTTNGFTESMGARPMARLINEKVKKPLAKELLFGDNITTVQLVLENDTLCVRTS
jgi:ATP-dependent Clp protease ATP-binding subunit ClpA